MRIEQRKFRQRRRSRILSWLGRARTAIPGFRKKSAAPETAPARGRALAVVPAPQRHRLFGVQYLRALAALGVVLFHAAFRCNLDFDAGASGVDLFFVISGFLMLTITDARTRPWSFLKDRFLRVVPLYWLATTGALVAVLTNASHTPLSVWFVTASYLLLPAILPLDTGPAHVWPVLAQGWTLSDEMLFYVLMTLALFLPRRFQMAALTLVIGAMVAVGVLFPSGDAFSLAWTDQILLEFVAGGWLGVLWRRRPEWPSWLGLPLILVGAATFVAFAVLKLPVSRLLSAGLPALLILGGTLCLERRRGGIPRNRFLLYLGDASYSTYLWHNFAISAVVGTAIDLTIRPTYAFWICGVAGLIGGLFLYWVLEAPLLALFRRRRYRHGAPIPGGV